MIVTVDRLFESPNGEIDRHVVNREFNEYSNDLLNSMGAILFGRVTGAVEEYRIIISLWYEEMEIL